MTKKMIVNELKDYDYRIIPNSWYVSDNKKCFLFTAYTTDYGSVYRFWIDENLKYASKQLLSDICVHKADEISHWFF